MQSISEWLQSLGLDQYAQVFVENDIDLGLIAKLSEQDLKDLGVSSMGHRKRLLSALDELGDPAEAVPSTPLSGQRIPIDSGERRQATVLFSDLSGYTAMTEKLDPEEVQTLMRRLKDRAVGIVEHHGGIVTQFVGDEVLALFGIPLAHEDDPVRAVRAGQEIHALARELSPEVEAKIGRPLIMHTGINTGLVLTSNADSRDGTIGVTGDTVNTGARLKALALDDAILLSPETARRVDAFVQLETLDAADLKGKQASLTPYKVIGKVSGQSRFEAASAQRGFTAFTGRDGEVAQLNLALERTANGEGQFVTVIGEAGAGKSRLIHEFRQSVNRDEISTLEGRCQSYGAETPYLPFLDALRRGLGLHQIAETEATHETAVTNIRNISPDLERYLPHLLHLLSIPSDVHKLPDGLEGDALRRELEEALAATITLNAAYKPMVLILEDWHWADEASDTTLNRLLGLVGYYSLMLVVIYRPEYERKWAEVENYTALVLHSLDVTETANMLAAVLGGKSLPNGLAHAVRARTGGNALFNEEIGYALRDEGMVNVADETVTLTRPLDELVLPDTVHAVIRARVDRLDSEDREVLRLASVIGREFDRAVLGLIAPPGQDVSAALARLSHQNLVHQVRVVPQAEYLFKHVLTQEVVYETLLLQQRKVLHAGVAQAIKTLYADRIEERYESLADHYSQSDEAENAIEYLEKAGDKAVASFSLGEARSRYESAYRFFKNTSPGQKAAQQFVDMVCRWAKISIGFPAERNVEALGLAQSLAEEADDLPRIGAVRAWKGYIHLMLGQVEQAIADTQFVADQADALAGQESLGIAYSILGRLQCFTHRVREAIGPLEESRKILMDAGIWNESGYSSGLSGLAHSIAGEFPVARERLDWARDLATERSILDTLAWVGLWSSMAEAMAGNWDDSARHGANGIQFAESIQSEWTASWCLMQKAQAEFMRGNAEEGKRELEREVQEYEAIGALLMFSWHLSYLGGIRVLCGEEDLAQEAVSRALAQKSVGDNIGEAWALESRMMLAAIRRDWESVRTDSDATIEICQTNGARPQLAINHFRYAECLHKKGDLNAARVQLAQADELFRDMGMPWWAEQAAGLRGRIDTGKEFVWFAPYVEGPPHISEK